MDPPLSPNVRGAVRTPRPRHCTGALRRPTQGPHRTEKSRVSPPRCRHPLSSFSTTRRGRERRTPPPPVTGVLRSPQKSDTPQSGRQGRSDHVGPSVAESGVGSRVSRERIRESPDPHDKYPGSHFTLTSGGQVFRKSEGSVATGPELVSHPRDTRVGPGYSDGSGVWTPRPGPPVAGGEGGETGKKSKSLSTYLSSVRRGVRSGSSRSGTNRTWF